LHRAFCIHTFTADHDAQDTMLISLTFLALLAASVPAATSDRAGTMPEPQRIASRQDACPPEHGWAESSVRKFLSNPLLPELQERARFTVGTASVDDVRLLTSERDGEACGALWTAIRGNGTDLLPGDAITFYRSGGMYFVPIDRDSRTARPGVIQLDGNSSLDLYDAEFRLVARFTA
jgi:hypothetical protein